MCHGGTVHIYCYFLIYLAHYGKVANFKYVQLIKSILLIPEFKNLFVCQLVNFELRSRSLNKLMDVFFSV